MVKAIPEDAKGHALNGDSYEFIGDWFAQGYGLRLFADPDETKVVILPAHDTKKEIHVDAATSLPTFRRKVDTALADALSDFTTEYELHAA